MFTVMHNGQPVQSYFSINRKTMRPESQHRAVPAVYPTYTQAEIHIWYAQGRPVEDALANGWAIEKQQ